MNNQNQGKKQGLNTLLKPGTQLTGQDLMHVARALTRQQVKPQADAYRSLIQGLIAQEHAQTRGLGRLGQQTTHQVGRTYRGLRGADNASMARQKALTSMVGGQLATSQGQQLGQLAGTQGAELGSQIQSLGMRDAPGGGVAQQQLAAMVGNQNAQAAAEAKAQAALSGNTAIGYGGLLANQAQASQAQGAAEKTQIHQDIASRIGAERVQALTDINAAKGKLADTRALKGSDLITNIMNLRKQEQDYLLGIKAVKNTRRGQNITAQDSAASTAASIANSRRASATSRANSRRTQRGENRRAQNSGSSSSSSFDRKQTRHNIKATVKRDIRQHFGGDFPYNLSTHKQKQIIGSLQHDASVGITGHDAFVNRVVSNYIKRHRPKGGGRSQSTGGPRPS